MNTITIFGRPGCGFCSRAKQLCEIQEYRFKYIDIRRENISQADLETTIGRAVQTDPCKQCHKFFTVKIILADFLNLSYL